jgi:hypothetical protein
MRYDADTLMNLLPAFYRVQDTDGSLRALMGVISEQIGVVETDLDQLYADAFIETCAEWAIPYIGDLIGYKPLPGTTSRAEVANTIGYRRRKGTAGVLEDLARDVTQIGAAVVVEYFNVLATTAHLTHPRPKHAGTASLKDIRALGRIGTPFDALPRSGEVRRIGRRGGRYNIPNVGIDLYRNRRLHVAHAQPFLVAKNVYTFHPLGLDQTLHQPPPEHPDGLDRRTSELDVPINIRRRTLEQDLEQHRQRLTDLAPSVVVLPFEILLNGTALKPEQLVASEIANAAVPFLATSKKVYTRTNVSPSISTSYPIVAAIDPVRGRFVLRDDIVVTSIEVKYDYAFPAPIGGGSYRPNLTDLVTHVVKGGGAPLTFATIAAALTDLAGKAGVIQIEDSRTYTDALTLTVAAPPASGARNRIVIRAKGGERPTLQLAGPLAIKGADGEVILEGLLIDDAGVAVTGNVGSLTLRDTTVTGPVTSPYEIDLNASIVGAVTAEALKAKDSVLMGDVKAELLSFEGVTALSDVATDEIDEVSDSIVVGAIVSQRLGTGCVRFSYLGAGSKVPKPHRCVEPPTLPVFTSLSLTHSGFARLHSFCPSAIAEGADDRGDMGAYHFLQEPRKEANLRIRIDEYLRLGLESGIERADEREIQR